MDFVEMDSAVRAVLFGGIFLVSLAVTLWLFYDAQERQEHMLPLEALAILGAALTLPALVISAFNLDVSQQDIVNPLSYLGLGGVAVAVLAVATYAVLSRQKAEEPVTVEETRPTPPPPPTEDTEQLQVAPEEPKTIIARREELDVLAFLVEKGGVHAGSIHRLKERTSIGRPGGSVKPDIMLDDSEVSRSHASIRLEEGRFVLKDLDSTNGTWLLTDSGKSRVDAPHALKDGDRIQVGSTVLAFLHVRKREDQPI